MFRNDEQKRDALIADWEAKKAALATAQDEEMKARLSVVGLYHEDITNLKGTENVELPRGWTLKMEFKQNRSVPSAKNGEAVRGVMDKLSAQGPEGALIAQRLFRWKPEVVAAEYDQLSPAARRIVDRVITTKPATPAISLVAPKV